MDYYSVKNIDTILEALTKNQYKKLMTDSVDGYGLSMFDVKNARNTITYKQVFGNKQRIWKKISIANSDNSGGNIIDNSSLDPTLVSFIRNAMFDLYTYLDDIGFQGDGALSYNKYINDDVNMWFNGYMFIDRNGKTRKYSIGKIINMLKDKIPVAYKNLSFYDTQSAINDTINKLNHIQKEFVNRMDEISGMVNVSNFSDSVWICISRYPADVGAMSTGQGWTSCQNLDKDGAEDDTICYDNYNWHVKYDIIYGTCIAYIMYESDINKSREQEPNNPLFPILHPKARVLIKPFYSIDKNGEIYLSIGTTPVVYPKDSSFGSTLAKYVNDYLIERQSNISGEFIMPPELYRDPIFNREPRDSVVVENGKVISAKLVGLNMPNEPVSPKVSRDIINNYEFQK